MGGYSQTLPALYAAPGNDFHLNDAGTQPASTGFAYDTGLGSPIANLLIPYLAGYTTPVGAQGGRILGAAIGGTSDGRRFDAVYPENFGAMSPLAGSVDGASTSLFGGLSTTASVYGMPSVAAPAETSSTVREAAGRLNSMPGQAESDVTSTSPVRPLGRPGGFIADFGGALGTSAGNGLKLLRIPLNGAIIWNGVGVLEFRHLLNLDFSTWI